MKVTNNPFDFQEQIVGSSDLYIGTTTGTYLRSDILYDTIYICSTGNFYLSKNGANKGLFFKANVTYKLDVRDTLCGFSFYGSTSNQYLYVMYTRNNNYQMPTALNNSLTQYYSRFNFLTTSLLDSKFVFSRASQGAYYDSTGTLQFATTNTPRFDYDPNTLTPKGVLLERAVNNVLTSSETFSDASTWSISSGFGTCSVAKNAVAPTGIANSATTVTCVSGFPALETIAVAPTTGANSFTFSAYVKKGNTNNANGFRVINNTTSTKILEGTFNYATGVITYTTGGTVGTTLMQKLPNDWWRLAISANTNFTAGNTLKCSVGFASQTNVVANDTFIIYGAQLENTTNVSSYVQNLGVQTTRAIDSMSISFTNNGMSSSVGTIVCNMDAILQPTRVQQVKLIDYSGNTSQYIMQSPNSSPWTTVRAQDSTPTVLTHQTLGVGNTWGAPFKFAYTWSNSSGIQASSIDAGAAKTAAFGSLQATCTGINFNRQEGNMHLGWIEFYPVQLSNAQLSEKTA